MLIVFSSGVERDEVVIYGLYYFPIGVLKIPISNTGNLKYESFMRLT